MIFRRLCLCVVLIGLWPFGALSQQAQVTMDATRSTVVSTSDGVQATLRFSGAVPFRVRHLQSPPRVMIDFIGADLSGIKAASMVDTNAVVDSAAGRLTSGESRLVLQFASPHQLDRALAEAEGEGLRIALLIKPVSEEVLAQAVAAEAVVQHSATAPVPAAPELRHYDGSRPLRVVLDPGHGGIDPGSLAGGEVEADLMLAFSFELRDLLSASGMEVFLTRDHDTYVSLERRVAIAQTHRADLMLSLHADALEEGDASGATVYTISDRASDKLSKLLVQRQDRAEILAGVDLHAQDDEVADVLTDLARQNTLPRSRALADEIAASIGRFGGNLHKHPRLEASFSVLKAAEVPSVLLELGFLSNEDDRDRLNDADWRVKMQKAILSALESWAKADAAMAENLRR